MLWLTLLACPTVLPSQSPPPSISFGGDLLVRNETSDIEVTLPIPADEVWLLVSFTGTGGPYCQVGVCTRLRAPTPYGPVSGSTGIATFNVDVPDASTVWLQVLARDRIWEEVSRVFVRDTVQEECDNGYDDDGDGLVDCEDGACWNSGFCGEFECDDRRDNDQDGLEDCEDDDCWGHGCRTVTTQVNAGLYTLTIDRHRGSHIASSRVQERLQQNLTLFALQGTVQVLTEQGSTYGCNWAARRVEAHGYTYHRSPYGRPMTVPLEVPSGMTLSPGCGLASSEVLPAYVHWSRPGYTGRFPTLGEVLSSHWGSPQLRLHDRWASPVRTYLADSTTGFVSSPQTRTTSYGQGPITVTYYNFYGETFTALEQGWLRGGDPVLQVAR